MAKQPDFVDGVRVRRRRRSALNFDEAKIGERVKKFFDDDLALSSDDRDRRLQQYAKLRMWTSGVVDLPWEGASDIALPDIAEKSFRIQDTLVNAVMASRPVISAQSTTKASKENEDKLTNLLDTQIFIEDDGERIVSELVDDFVNQGIFTVFIPWIKEVREVIDRREFDPIPEGISPLESFRRILQTEFQDATKLEAIGNDVWDYSIELQNGEEIRASFYTTKGGKIELLLRREVVVHDGPKIIRKDYDDVLCPPRCGNLQIAGPSNPTGATHVILRDNPTKDEIVRLVKSGWYDLVSNEELKRLKNATRQTFSDSKEQKDVLEGTQEETAQQKGAETHEKLTRLTCFDMYDIDGDGVSEDVIWWVIYETGTVLRARYLTEVFPSNPPRRPLAEAAFIPVPGRRRGLSLPEILEPIHDAQKMLMDQTVDAGTFSLTQFGFYRPMSNLKPDIIRLQPGELYPLGDPQRDVNFPQFNSNNVNFGINMMTILGGKEDRLAMENDLNFGNVPAGKSSALRTTGNMALLLGQSQARPERMLRRLFLGLSDIWEWVHQLNKTYLPKDKEFRIIGAAEGKDEIYGKIEDMSQMKGKFSWTFVANILNTTKAALQQSLAAFGQIYVSELTLQLGIATPEGVFRWMRDQAKAWGLNPDDYINPPNEDALLPRIMAEEAVQIIMQDKVPNGVPAEAGGAIEHFQALQQFAEDDNVFGRFKPPQVQIFAGYMQEVAQRAQLQQQQQAILQAAGSLQGQGGGQGGRPPGPGAPVDTSPPQTSGSNELVDEALPTAGGGGQQ